MGGRTDMEIHAEGEPLFELFSTLVSIDSPSGHERAAADYVKKFLSDLGAGVSEDDAPSRDQFLTTGNVLGRMSGTLPGEPLLFSAHLDTVMPGIGKKAVLHDGGRITSSGNTVLGADDAAGVAEILEAVRILETRRIPHRSLELLFPVAEEVYCRGSRVLDFSILRSKEAYVLDLSGQIGSAAVGAPTLISFSVEVKGKAAHAGFEPEKGVHAIQAAAGAVQKLQLGRIGTHSTRNIGTIRGGTATNIVPDSVILEGEIRGAVHSDALALMEETRTLFETAAAACGASAAVTSDIRIHAYTTPPESSAVRNFSAACRSLGLKAQFAPTFGGSDNNNFALYGITGIVAACGMQQPHTTGEYTTLDDLRLATELVLQLMTTPAS